MPFLPDPIPNPAMDPTSRPTKQQLPRSPLHPTSDDPPRPAHPASAMTRSAALSGPSKPRSFIIKQLEAMAVGPDKPDNKAAAVLTALTKCRTLNGGAGRGKKGGWGEAEEKRVASEVGRGRRRSFGAVDVDVGCVFAGAGARVVAKDMPPFMMVHAVTFARKAFDGMEKFSSKTLAFSLKKEFDDVYGPAWHCIVGTSFGSFVTHSVGGFLYFSLDKLHILLFKTTVQRAD